MPSRWAWAGVTKSGSSRYTRLASTREYTRYPADMMAMPIMANSTEFMAISHIVVSNRRWSRATIKSMGAYHHLARGSGLRIPRPGLQETVLRPTGSLPLQETREHVNVRFENKAPTKVNPIAAVLCWLTVALEGFDLVALGAVIPTLLQTQHLGMDRPALTFAATISLVGVGVGAATVGPVADRFGRRLTLLACILSFSVFTALLPTAGTAISFALLRFLAGLGLGACMPVALTMMSEVAPPQHRAKASTLTMTGYHVGAVATSLLALAVTTDWHLIFYAGGFFGLALLPVMWFLLPESGHVTASERKPRLPLSTVLRGPYARASIGAWVGSFMGLLLVYGLNTWLPQIMRDAGYPLTAALNLLLLMNVGAVVGLLLAGWVADRSGIKRSVLVWFAAAAIFLAVLSIRMANPLLLNAAVFVTGIFVFSAQVLIYALITHLFASEIRGTALGLTSGIGRIGAIVGPAVTGTLVAAGSAYPWGFYVFAVVAVLGLLSVTVVPANIYDPQREDA